MKNDMMDARISIEDREDQVYIKDQSGHEPLRKSEGVGVISPNNPELNNPSKYTASIDL